MPYPESRRGSLGLPVRPSMFRDLRRQYSHDAATSKENRPDSRYVYGDEGAFGEAVGGIGVPVIGAVGGAVGGADPFGRSLYQRITGNGGDTTERVLPQIPTVPKQTPRSISGFNAFSAFTSRLIPDLSKFRSQPSTEHPLEQQQPPHRHQLPQQPQPSRHYLSSDNSILPGTSGQQSLSTDPSSLNHSVPSRRLSAQMMPSNLEGAERLSRTGMGSSFDDHHFHPSTNDPWNLPNNPMVGEAASHGSITGGGVRTSGESDGSVGSGYQRHHKQLPAVPFPGKPGIMSSTANVATGSGVTTVPNNPGSSEPPRVFLSSNLYSSDTNLVQGRVEAGGGHPHMPSMLHHHSLPPHLYSSSSTSHIHHLDRHQLHSSAPYLPHVPQSSTGVTGAASSLGPHALPSRRHPPPLLRGSSLTYPIQGGESDLIERNLSLGGVHNQHHRNAFETLRNDSLSSDQSSSPIGPGSSPTQHQHHPHGHHHLHHYRQQPEQPPTPIVRYTQPHHRTRSKGKRLQYQFSLSSSEEDFRNTPEHWANQKIDSENFHDDFSKCQRNLKREEILDAKIKKFLAVSIHYYYRISIKILI